MQVSGDPAGLNGHKIATNTTYDGSKYGHAFVLLFGNGFVQDEPSETADHHCQDDREPAELEDLHDGGAPLGSEDPHRSQGHEADADQWSHIPAVWEEKEKEKGDTCSCVARARAHSTARQAVAWVAEMRGGLGTKGSGVLRRQPILRVG